MGGAHRVLPVLYEIQFLIAENSPAEGVQGENCLNFHN
jgi:hypothetical protein